MPARQAEEECASGPGHGAGPLLCWALPAVRGAALLAFASTVPLTGCCIHRACHQLLYPSCLSPTVTSIVPVTSRCIHRGTQAQGRGAHVIKA